MDRRGRQRRSTDYAPILAGNHRLWRHKIQLKGESGETHRTSPSTLPRGHSQLQHTVVGLPSRSSPCTTRLRRTARSASASWMSAARRAASSTASRSGAVVVAGAAAAARRHPPSGAPLSPAPTRAAARAADAAVVGAATQAVRGSPPSLLRGEGGVAMVDWCRSGRDGGRRCRVTSAGATTNAITEAQRVAGRGGWGEGRGADGKGAPGGEGRGEGEWARTPELPAGGVGAGNFRARARWWARQGRKGCR